jgi:cytochrome oxidase Cu insertion factor (SCO1/SenC/PrrC family)/thiol-disulfide isomerase/thioredoxin
VSLAFFAALVVVVVALAIGPGGTSGGPLGTPLETNPDLDPGTALSGKAPDFTLTSQFGRPVSLHSFRGHVVILAFNDAECTTVCPLTTTAMVEAKGLLGAAGAGVELLGIDANPDATAVKWVRAYSQVHGMLHQWQFLTGTTPQLRAVWRAYHIEVEIEAGQIDHTPALYVIDRRGRLSRLFLTQMAYRSVDQQAQILAKQVSRLLPGNPRVHSALSYNEIPAASTTSTVALPRAGGGSVRIGPDGSPRLYLFFASWLTETINLRGDLDALRRYQSLASSGGLPKLTAVDEGSVEPTPQALPRFLATLKAPLSFPVAIDRSGRVADGYIVQDQPWFVLVSRSGRILWYLDASTSPWPSVAALVRDVGAALKTPTSVKPPSVGEVPKILAGSPAPLAALHRQASRVIDSQSSFAALLRSLRGYPIVVNVWASWCPACQAEYPEFAAASVRYGRQVAFVGADTDDYSASAAQAYLDGHVLSYPSYVSSFSQLAAIAPPGINAMPTTIFIDRAGEVTHRNIGGYESEGALDGDIQTYALGD